MPTSPALTNNTISGNGVTSFGGGVCCYSSSPLGRGLSGGPRGGHGTTYSLQTREMPHTHLYPP